MNLFFKSYKFYLFFFLLCALKPAVTLGYQKANHASLRPAIHRIALPVHFAGTPNYSFFRSETGVIFIGKENGILTINEDQSYFNSIPGPVYIFSNDSKEIQFFGSENYGKLNFSPGSGSKITEQKTYADKIPIRDSLFEKINSSACINILPNTLQILELPGNRQLIVSANQNIFILHKNSNIKSKLFTISDQNKLKTVFTDIFDDTWLLFEYQLYKIDFPSKEHNINISMHLQGEILTSTLADSLLYLGTTLGLEIFNTSTGKLMKSNNSLDQKNHPINIISANKQKIYAAGNNGIYKIDKYNISHILEGTYDFLKIIDENNLVLGSDQGLKHIRISPEKIDEAYLNKNITNIYQAVQHHDNTWLLSNNKIYQLKHRSLTSEEIPFESKQELQGIRVLNDSLYIFDYRTVWFWNSDLEKFSKARPGSISPELLNKSLIKNTAFSTWKIDKNNNLDYVLWKMDSESYKIPFYEITESTTFGEIINLHEDEDHIWIVGDKKLLRLDKNLNDPEHINPLKIQLVNRVFLNKEKKKELIHEGADLRYSQSNITFFLSDMQEVQSGDTYFRYKLNHVQNDWSEWRKEKKITFHNLKERKYTFSAQSASSFGRLSETVEFKFRIRPPFYRAWYAWTLYVILLLATIFLFYKWRMLNLKTVESRIELQIKDKMDNILREKAKSDKLVEDLFPKSTAEELKSKGRAKSEKYERATVLFSDIQGFTKIAEEMNPEVLIDELDKFFFHFDSVVEKYNIEKIKTIGDAYMAAGGIPIKNNTNPVEVVLAGLEMQHYMQDLKKNKANIWDLRIGIHTGAVISGVVGHKKLSYDIWGDTVNTASRMESSGEGGKVNISGATYALVKDYFLCEYRGKLPVKYKGNIDMYFVTGLRPELSIDLKGLPNRRFFLKLQMLRIQDLSNFLFEEILQKQLPSLHFHKKEFIQKIARQAELLGRSENVSEEDLLIVQSAAIMMYSGLSETYSNYEMKSAEIARRTLADFSYNKRQIDRVCNLILSVKAPFNPQNILEEILIDAKMEYIGRADYLTQLKLLHMEIKNFSKEISKERFVKEQISILNNFSFFTVAGQRLREVNAIDQIQRIKDWR